MSSTTSVSGGASVTAVRELRILLVDDTVDIRLLLRLLLDTDGRFDVVGEAGDGSAAIEAAATLRPDVILLDLAMPVMDGLEALPEIRRRSPDSKIIILSGFNAREMSAEALRLGASSYLEKGDIANRLVPHILQLFPEHTPTSVVPPSLVGIPAPTAVGAPAPEQAPPHDLTAEWGSVLAHELNNPVAVLQGFAMLLQQATDSMQPDAIKKSAAAISRSAQHIGSLIAAFADLRKIEVDSLDLVLESTDLSDLVRETVSDMAEVMGTHSVIVEVGGPVVAIVDTARVRQVLINLLANAAKFSPAQTDIDIRVAVARGKAEISVRDRGPGIKASDMSSLFRKFSRLDPNIAGMGIGLFLSRGIARAHGGDLVLDESSGPGCRFVLVLPLP